jgi:hypothetical protein
MLTVVEQRYTRVTNIHQSIKTGAVFALTSAMTTGILTKICVKSDVLACKGK